MTYTSVNALRIPKPQRVTAFDDNNLVVLNEVLEDLWNITNGRMTEIDDDLAVDGYVTVSKVWHAYGGFQDEAETISISTKNVWTFITNATNNLWTGLEADGLTLDDDVMCITNGGDYAGTVSITFAAGNNKDFEFRVYNVTQATIAGYHVGATGLGAGNNTNITLPFYLEADAGDQFRMEVRCTTDASNPTLTDAVFYMAYLHD